MLLLNCEILLIIKVKLIMIDNENDNCLFYIGTSYQICGGEQGFAN